MKIAVSACLVGEKVRFDGGAKSSRFIIDKLSKFAKFTSFCPEFSLFGSPRESIRVVTEDRKKRVIGNKGGEDYTAILATCSGNPRHLWRG